ncbi:TetR/AcrR family transcriptional regulator [Nocardioides sambongensis]|uniref:TetR/AcrR family transcriptional regulator n=1 Tax=Nocardioides sambongensis TaxID=2589074 RepID=UPI0011286641|nr:TetR/AcrR family transcriptional regulator [Nocardioides sambongensis]
MADVIEESGLSAGSLYSHFDTKEQLIELVASRVIGERADLLSAGSEEAEPRAPLEIVRWWLSGVEQDGLPFGAALQIWGEAASDPGIRAVVERRMAAIEGAFASSAERWLTATGGDPTTAGAVARAMLVLCQGYIVRTAVLGPQDLGATLAAVALLVGADDDAVSPSAGRHD